MSKEQATFSSWLRRERQRHGWTAGDLAIRSGVGLATIFQVERCEVLPRLLTIRALAAALEVEPLALARALAADRARLRPAAVDGNDEQEEAHQ